jgi:hypothetical protein
MPLLINRHRTGSQDIWVTTLWKQERFVQNFALYHWLARDLLGHFALPDLKLKPSCKGLGPTALLLVINSEHSMSRDIDRERVAELDRRLDRTREVMAEEFARIDFRARRDRRQGVARAGRADLRSERRAAAGREPRADLADCRIDLGCSQRRFLDWVRFAFPMSPH